MRTFVFIVATAAIAAAITQLPYARAESAIDRGKYLVTWRLQRLPHARIFLRQAGHDEVFGRLGGRIRNPGLGAFADGTSHSDKETGIGDWTARANHNRLATRQAARRPHARTDHAVSRVLFSFQR